MTKCDGCGKEVGKLYCGKCRDKIEKTKREIDSAVIVPLLFYDRQTKTYLFACRVRGCPCNNNGICKTEHKFLPKQILHEFDGDNIIQQVCG